MSKGWNFEEPQTQAKIEQTKTNQTDEQEHADKDSFSKLIQELIDMNDGDGKIKRNILVTFLNVFEDPKDMPKELLDVIMDEFPVVTLMKPINEQSDGKIMKALMDWCSRQRLK